jgi:hypothetical protein
MNPLNAKHFRYNFAMQTLGYLLVFGWEKTIDQDHAGQSLRSMPSMESRL